MNEMSSGTAPGFAKHPGYVLEVLSTPKRVRVVFGGETLADTTAALIVRESGHMPVYYLPRADIRLDLLTATDHSSYCPFKGTAAYWSIAAGDKVAENAVWSYPSPYREAGALKDHMAFYWNRVDHWYEEDEEVLKHPRDPKVRVDVLSSRREVSVRLEGELVAKSSNALFVFETGMPVRYYLPAEDVRMDLLRPVETSSICPYKGKARYWQAELGGKVFDDIAWAYPDPFDEVRRIRDRIAFFDERVDEVFVDGIAQARPKTQWSA
ncbi:DUF427 domain-containing protein [Oceanibacterium hippocampi]|uniref:DUF427 domain-containing protein n=1 Tax=Oceanibacterium hippocampi TaxID=745714 RepID=A0A1Y5RY84_9PROT|nr:DUF427 domain-containing protein [Oceanibacterium hippocampi]SLN28310.1 hypothetical protein OCH7691_00945 [Oceanibacterium hippocampi]